MASQAVTEIAGVKDAGGGLTAGSYKTESASGGVDGGVSRKRLLSGDDCDNEKECNKKLKQQPVKVQEEMSAEISPDSALSLSSVLIAF